MHSKMVCLLHSACTLVFLSRGFSFLKYFYLRCAYDLVNFNELMTFLAACQAMCMLQIPITTKSARSHQQVREGGKSQSSLLVCEH